VTGLRNYNTVRDCQVPNIFTRSA